MRSILGPKVCTTGGGDLGGPTKDRQQGWLTPPIWLNHDPATGSYPAAAEGDAIPTFGPGKADGEVGDNGCRNKGTKKAKHPDMSSSDSDVMSGDDIGILGTRGQADNFNRPVLPGSRGFRRYNKKVYKIIAKASGWLGECVVWISKTEAVLGNVPVNEKFDI